MTAAIPPPADAGPAVGPPGGALVRIVVETEGRASVPPAPVGADITVSFSSAAAAAASAAALAALGYRYVGLSPVSASSPPVADFLVPQAIVDQHRQWWSTMADHADQIFALAFGPAHAALREILRLHRQPLR